MRLFVLAFAGGIWLLQQQAALPDLPWMAGLAGGAVSLFGLRRWLLKPWAAGPRELCEAVSLGTALAARRFAASAMLAAAAAALGFVWAASLDNTGIGFRHERAERRRYWHVR